MNPARWLPILSSFSEWPLKNLFDPDVGHLDTEDLALITSITRLNPLSFEITNNSSPGVATATISAEGMLKVEFLDQPGVTEVTVTATDLDGASTPYTFSVRNGSMFGSWIAQFDSLTGDAALASANPEKDAFTNLQDYAFGTDPTSFDSGPRSPFAENLPHESGSRPGISFWFRSDSTDLRYIVEKSSSLSDDWESIWISDEGDGIDAANVARKEDLGGGLLKLGIIDAAGSRSGYFRIRVELK